MSKSKIINKELNGQYVKINLKNGLEMNGILTINNNNCSVEVNGVLFNADEIIKIEPYYSPIERHLLLVLNEKDIEFIRKIGIKTYNTSYDKIIEQIENYLQEHGIKSSRHDSDIYLNEDGLHCESILDSLSNLDSLNKEDLYTYAEIIYDDDIVARTIKEPSFYYKTDLNVNVGDKVLVDRNGKNVIGEIISLEYREKDNVPYPLDKTKNIIKVISQEQKLLCPNCNNKLIPIIYGMPDSDIGQKAMNGEVFLGGCMISDKDPIYHCNNCRRSYYDNLSDYIEEGNNFEDFE